MDDISNYGDATIAFLIAQEQKRKARYRWAVLNSPLLDALYAEQARRRVARMDPEERRYAEQFAEDDHG